MREQFIPYKQALELRDLGFDEKCLVTESKVGYARNPSTDMEELLIQEPFYWTNSKIHSDNCTLPLWQQAFDWFREKYDLLGYVQDESSIDDNVNIHDKWMYVIQELPIVLHDDLSDNVLYKTHQEARQACLEKLIELVKSKLT